MTELWDTQLPFEKLTKISRYLPRLTTLYTRAACLLPEPNIVPALTNLTADFDFVQYGPQFYRFLSFNGSTVRRLVLIDQVNVQFYSAIFFSKNEKCLNDFSLT